MAKHNEPSMGDDEREAWELYPVKLGRDWEGDTVDASFYVRGAFLAGLKHGREKGYVDGVTIGTKLDDLEAKRLIANAVKAERERISRASFAIEKMHPHLGSYVCATSLKSILHPEGER